MRTVTEFAGNCTKLEPESLADCVYTPIFLPAGEQGSSSCLSEHLLGRFDQIISKIDEKCKSSKLIENVVDINNQAVLVDEIERAEIDRAIASVTTTPPENDVVKCKLENAVKTESQSDQAVYDFMIPPKFSTELNSYSK